MCQGPGAYLLSYSGLLLHPAGHCARQDSAAGHPLPRPHQHVQLNNVSCSKDDNPSLVILILNPSLAFLCH